MGRRVGNLLGRGIELGLAAVQYEVKLRDWPVQQTGGSAPRFSTEEDEWNASEASSRRVCGPSQSELCIVGFASLITYPMDILEGERGTSDGKEMRHVLASPPSC